MPPYAARYIAGGESRVGGKNRLADSVVSHETFPLPQTQTQRPRDPDPGPDPDPNPNPDPTDHGPPR